jgi:hypothetical protein
MQLINPAVYDRKHRTEQRIWSARASLENRKNGVRKAKVLRYAQGPGANAMVSTTASPATGHQILVNDVAFRVANGGSKLIRISSAYFSSLFTSNLLTLHR